MNLMKCISSESFKFEKDRIYCKYNYEVLKLIEDDILNKNFETMGNVLFELHSIIARFLENQKNPIVFMEKYPKEKISTVQYLWKLFQIMTKYLFLFFSQENKSSI